MMKSQYCFLMIFILLLSCPARSQSLAVNTSGAVADGSAILDISSSSKGILVPRVALTATNAAGPVTSPLTSLVVYNTATAGFGATAVTPGFYYWNGTGWDRFQTGPASGWSINGNAGTNPSTHFIGTTDATDLRFRRNNTHAGLIGTTTTALGNNVLNAASTGVYNTAIGASALAVNTSGLNNTAVGGLSLAANTTGFQNTAIGASVLTANTTGGQNHALGFGVLTANTTGNGNVGIGQVVLLSNTTGNYNIGMGYTALYSNLSGGYNIAMGYTALYNNTSGSYNIGIGYGSFYSNATGNGHTGLGTYSANFNGSGSNNTAIGHYSAYLGSTGNETVSVGFNALFINSGGNQNVAVGSNAGYFTTGSNNITIGYNADVPTAAGDNQVRIGNSSITYAGVQVAWSVTSDFRWKKDIRESVPGLDFIKQLRPVSYLRKNDKTGKREYGFIAQDLNSVLQTSDPQNGIISTDDKGYLSVRYNDLLAPMVKAIQEQQVLIEKLQAEIENLKAIR